MKRGKNYTNVFSLTTQPTFCDDAFTGFPTKSVGTLRSDDGDGNGNENVKQAIGLFNSQNNNFALASRFLVHFFPVTARLRRGNA